MWSEKTSLRPGQPSSGLGIRPARFSGQLVLVVRPQVKAALNISRVCAGSVATSAMSASAASTTKSASEMTAHTCEYALASDTSSPARHAPRPRLSVSAKATQPSEPPNEASLGESRKSIKS